MNSPSDSPSSSAALAAPLRRFVDTLTRQMDSGPADEATMLATARKAMQALVARDDWLPEAMAQPHPQYYQQYLLYVDPQDRFSVVSFVWGPGQMTPVHDHCTWGVIGMLRGEETGQAFRIADGRLEAVGPAERLAPGDVAAVSPTIGDIHRVANVFDDRVSISIHAYGTDIGKQQRHVYDPQTGAAKPFVSGYANRSS